MGNKRTWKIIVFTILLALTLFSCVSTRTTSPLVYTHNPSTEFEILGTIFFRSNTSVGYNTVFEEARRHFPTTDFVIDIMIDKHEITTSYHFIAMAFRFLFSANMKQENTTYEYTIRGTAIRYIRRNTAGEIIAMPTPRAERNPSLSISAVVESILSTPVVESILSTPSREPAHNNTSSSNNVAIPINFIGTWKRDNFDNTLTITENGILSSSSASLANLTNVSNDLYTFRRNSRRNSRSFTYKIIFVDENIVISGGNGVGQGNWNGIWKKL